MGKQKKKTAPSGEVASEEEEEVWEEVCLEWAAGKRACRRGGIGTPGSDQSTGISGGSLESLLVLCRLDLDFFFQQSFSSSTKNVALWSSYINRAELK